MQDFRMDTFLEVCQYMNYTKAAEALHITQPAVSQHIHILEENYGVKLFSYEGKRLKLTREGEILLRAAQTARHDERSLEERLREVGNENSSLTFGATLTIGEFALPKKLALYMKKHPDKNIHMQVANTHELLKRLDNGEIDFAIVEGYFEKSKYEHRIFSTEDYICVRGNEYQLRREEVTQLQLQPIASVLDETLITREDGSGTREILQRYLQEQNYSVSDFAKVTEMNNMQAIKTMVGENCGITFLYRAAVEEELKQGSLQEVELVDFPLKHEFNFIWQQGSLFAKDYEDIYRLLR